VLNINAQDANALLEKVYSISLQEKNEKTTYNALLKKIDSLQSQISSQEQDDY